MIRLDVLPAGHGDCLMVTWGSGSARRRMLIDAGTAESYDGGLRRYLLGRPQLKRIDLMVVTHVDTDHIDGAICLLRDIRRDDSPIGVSVERVWFNRFGDHRGGLQGEYFTHLLEGLAVNEAFADGVVGRDTGGHVRLPLGAQVIMLNPGDDERERMRAEWEATCRKQGYVAGADTADVAALLAKRRTYRVEDLDRDREAVKRPGSDRAAPNGVSIAFAFEYGGRRVLFTGDAHARSLELTLGELCERWGVERVRFDVVKLSHHGSVRNVTPALLDLVDCRHFVVSTDGAVHGHPDAATFDLLAEYHERRGWRAPLTVSFNHASRVPSQANDRLRYRTAAGGVGVSIVLR